MDYFSRFNLSIKCYNPNLGLKMQGNGSLLLEHHNVACVHLRISIINWLLEIKWSK